MSIQEAQYGSIFTYHVQKCVMSWKRDEMRWANEEQTEKYSGNGKHSDNKLLFSVRFPFLARFSHSTFPHLYQKWSMRRWKFHQAKIFFIHWLDAEPWEICVLSNTAMSSHTLLLSVLLAFSSSIKQKINAIRKNEESEVEVEKEQKEGEKRFEF